MTFDRSDRYLITYNIYGNILREDICSQTFFLLFQVCQSLRQMLFVSKANRPLISPLTAVADVTVSRQ